MIAGLFTKPGPLEPMRLRVTAAEMHAKYNFLAEIPANPDAYHYPELQREYATAYAREIRDQRDARYCDGRKV